MQNSKKVSEAIQETIKIMMDRVMENVLVKDPFIPEEHHAKKPLYAALVPDEVFYALPYNPYGKKENYSWSFPMRWFDMKNDKVVLIGDEFWDFLGGKGTYQMFISEINKLGKEYRQRIYKEFLGIEPPEREYERRL